MFSQEGVLSGHPLLQVVKGVGFGRRPNPGPGPPPRPAFASKFVPRAYCLRLSPELSKHRPTIIIPHRPMPRMNGGIYDLTLQVRANQQIVAAAPD